MADWGKLFADPEMQRLRPNAALLSALPALWDGGCRRVLDAGCGVGRHLLPLTDAGFRVWGVDREEAVIALLKAALSAKTAAGPAFLVRADLARLPFPAGAFDLAVSINVINHGPAAAFRAYCRELDRVLRPGGHLFVNVSPREFAHLVVRPETRELEPGTFVNIATPDGDLVHHFPTPGELLGRFPGYRVHRIETVPTPIPFMGDALLPQLVFWSQKGEETVRAEVKRRR